MSYDRQQIVLERSELSEGLGGKYVDTNGLASPVLGRGDGPKA